jgi:hypothetical protein
LTVGDAILDVMKGRNLAIAGMIDEAVTQDINFEPLVWCQAEPGGVVAREAYERVVTLFLDAIARKGPFDAVLLDLHGAMVVEGIGDGEGDFVRRIREAVGTYPHVDMAETGRRTARVAFDMCRSRKRFAKAFSQAPYLIPIPSQCTLAEPTGSIYARLEAIERAHDVHLSFLPGFPPSDTADCGPSILGYGMEGQEYLDRHMRSLVDFVEKAEAGYTEDRIFNEADAVRLALETAASAARPVILVDTQDNPGAGGTGDSTGLVRQLVKQEAPNAVRLAKVIHGSGLPVRLWHVMMAGNSRDTANKLVQSGKAKPASVDEADNVGIRPLPLLERHAAAYNFGAKLDTRSGDEQAAHKCRSTTGEVTRNVDTGPFRRQLLHSVGHFPQPEDPDTVASSSVGHFRVDDRRLRGWLKGQKPEGLQKGPCGNIITTWQ